MDSSTSNRFYYSIHGQDVVGPCEFDDLAAAYAAGTLPGTSSVCQEGTERWQPIQEICGSPEQFPRPSPTAPVPEKTALPLSGTCPKCHARVQAIEGELFGCPTCGEQLRLWGPNRPSTKPNGFQPVLDASPYGCVGFGLLIVGLMLTLTGVLAILGVPLMIAGFVLIGGATGRMLVPPKR